MKLFTRIFTKSQQKNELNFLVIGLTTLMGIGGLGWILIALVQERSLLSLVFGPLPFTHQLVYGLGCGIMLGLMARFLLRCPFMEKAVVPFASIGEQLTSTIRIILLSMSAGMGEEILFRGALQYWLGIVITAVIFIVIHGFIDHRNWRKSVYGGFALLASIGFGYLAKDVGLTAPIVAHSILNLFVYFEIRFYVERQRSAKQEINCVI